MAYPNHVQNLLDNLKEVLEVLAIHSKVAGKTPPPLLVLCPTTRAGYLTTDLHGSIHRSQERSE